MTARGTARGLPRIRGVLLLLGLAAAAVQGQQETTEPETPPQRQPEAQQKPAAEEGLKIYISADMEGVVGVVTGDQLGPDGFEYERFREFMTAEVNACIAA